MNDSGTNSVEIAEPEIGHVLKRSQEVFDSGVYAALEICRRANETRPTVNALREFEKRLIFLALRQTGGNRLEAAGLLGIGRSTLTKRMRLYGIRVTSKVV